MKIIRAVSLSIYKEFIQHGWAKYYFSKPYQKGSYFTVATNLLYTTIVNLKMLIGWRVVWVYLVIRGFSE
jgi:hypothetical protein